MKQLPNCVRGLSLRVPRALVWTSRLHVICPFQSLGGNKSCWKLVLLFSLRKNLTQMSCTCDITLDQAPPDAQSEVRRGFSETGCIYLSLCPRWWMARSAWVCGSFSYVEFVQLYLLDSSCFLDKIKDKTGLCFFLSVHLVLARPWKMKEEVKSITWYWFIYFKIWPGKRMSSCSL